MPLVHHPPAPLLPSTSSSSPLFSQVAQEVQRSNHELYRLEAIDFGRRLAVEREIEKTEDAPPQNAVFDESGNFILYPTLLGIKLREGGGGGGGFRQTRGGPVLGACTSDLHIFLFFIFFKDFELSHHLHLFGYEI